MLIKKPEDVKSSEITDEKLYRSRRQVLRMGVLGASVAATGYVYRKFNPLPRFAGVEQRGIVITKAPPTVDLKASGFVTDEPKTPYDIITNYNNFYEFSPNKEGVAPAAANFVSEPWKVVVGGLCAKPKTFDLDDIKKVISAEERIYRMRCVEGWSMVIPWVGFPLGKLLELVQPNSAAKYVRFVTLFDTTRMPMQNTDLLPWPYQEGLRMDEAMHPLAILALGLYGKILPPQDGAPIRLVVPWKYGFKGIKSIVKIELTDKQPDNTWHAFMPDEYGFYANVNPAVDHPRWSQKTELRLGDGWRRPTLPFNGYADQVAKLYAGMDLRANY